MRFGVTPRGWFLPKRRSLDMNTRLNRTWLAVGQALAYMAVAGCGGGGSGPEDMPPAQPANARRAVLAATESWTQIASEGQSFTVSGTQTVRYGAGSNWVQKSVTNSGQCT